MTPRVELPRDVDSAWLYQMGMTWSVHVHLDPDMVVRYDFREWCKKNFHPNTYEVFWETWGYHVMLSNEDQIVLLKMAWG